MKSFFPIREKPALAPYKSGDVLVLFGELFNRGYGNGLVEEAEKIGMTIVRATVGRREKDGTLRALTPDEAALVPKPFINIPLEAGFDMESALNGLSPIDQMKDIKLSEWQNAVIDMEAIAQSRAKGTARFCTNVQAFLVALEAHIPSGKNVLFAHLMAGGVPRTKIVMPLMNRAFKGIGDRYLSSEIFWNSCIGQVCSQSFNEVTAETFRHLLELSTPFREKIKTTGSHTSYIAYGYHGTEIVYDGQYHWQSYSPYLQGWAKLELENISKEYFDQGVASCVYNCPEILTNSSSIFQGVEVPLYALIAALKKESDKNNYQTTITQKILADCKALLNDDVSFEKIQKIIEEFYHLPVVQEHCQFDKWPQHSTALQLQSLIEQSELLISLHKDAKALMTAVLSEVVFTSCGYVMLHDSWKPQHPSAWIGHDLVVKCL